MSTAAYRTVTYATAGTYDVLLTVTNAAGTESMTQEDLITIGTTPPATIDLTTELGSLDVIVVAPSDPSIDSWSWNFGDGTSATGSTAMHTYQTSGTYTIALTTTNECGSNTAQVEVTILTAPTATFSSSALSICPGETVVLQADETEGVTYNWDIPGGDPGSSTEAMVMTSFTLAGSYDVSLTATNAAGTTTSTQTIIVNPLPVADFSFEVNGLTVTFTNFSENANNYTWQFPDTENTEENPVFTFPGVGSYDAVLIVENDCGTDMRTMTVVLEGTIPNVNFTVENNEGCDAITVSFFSDTDNADEILWSFPGGTPSTSTDPKPIVTYAEPGEYTVTLSATNAFGTNAITQENIVVIFEPISAQVTYDLDVTTATFTANTTGVTNFTWTFPDGSTSMEAEPSYTFPGNGVYTVTYNYSGPCGTGTSTVEVEIAGELPVVNITLDQDKGCAPFVVTFTDQSSNTPESWNWSFPGGDPEMATGSTATVTYENAGTYSISLEVTNAYGTSTMDMTDVVEVLNAPNAPSFTSETMDDINFDFAVTDPVSDWVYRWDFGDGTTASGTAASHMYTEDGTYDVVLIAVNDCGEASTTEIVVAVITSTQTPVWAVGLQLAPNPTPEVLFISAQSWPGSGSLHYRLLNALGQEMNNGLWMVGAGNWRQTLDMSRLPAGTYWLQLGWNNELWTQKVIKQ